MATSPKIPVIIGVGDVKNRSQKLKDAIEPMQLMLQATLCAIKDAMLTLATERELLSNIDSINVVATWTWPYADLPGLLSEELGIQPQHKVYSEHGGNQPISLFDEAARRISQGNSTVTIVTGGEALASLSACAAAKTMPPPGWTAPDPDVQTLSLSNLSQLKAGIGIIHSIGLPIHVYPLYENGYRAYRRQTMEQNNRESAHLYAQFAKVAEHNPFSWNYGQSAPTNEIISTVTKSNRLICYPYPLLMNAFNNVNLAASCILTSTEYARTLGIPESKWVYALGGAGTQDSNSFWERPDFHSSASISRTLDAGLEISGLATEQIDLFDFYSPPPNIGSYGYPLSPLTSIQALTAMVRELRNGNGQNGLILANGGVLTYQHVVCLSTEPRRDGSAYPDKNPLPCYVTDLPVPPICAQAEGEATVETYTVEFDRNAIPTNGFIVGRLASNDHRFVANAGDAKTLEQLSSRVREPIGRIGRVKSGARGRNLFVFEQSANL